MALPHNTQCFLLSLWMVLSIKWCYVVTGSNAPIHLTAGVGGNVTIHCPCDKSRTITFFYFQRGKVFVNGYYGSKKISDEKIQPWENTSVDHDKTTVHMSNLNISHNGVYTCHIMYSGAGRTSDTLVHLNVTANYSKPEVTKKCSEGLGCSVKCASHGGYPEAKVVWNIPRSQTWNVVNNSQMPNPVTMTINSSSTTFFNCSNGELKFLNCTVGGVTSDMFSVCTQNGLVYPDNTYVIAAICAVGIFTLFVAGLLCWKCMRRPPRAADVALEEEAVQLSKHDRREDAP